MRNYASVTERFNASGPPQLPDRNSSFIILDPPSPTVATDGGRQVWPIPPFQVLLSLETLAEVAVVTEIQLTADGRQMLSLSRSQPVDFRKGGGVYPEDWQCPYKWCA